MRVLGVFVIVAMTGVVGVAAIAGGAAAPPEPDGAGTSIGDIPSSLVGVYVAAAGSCPGLPWSVLAAIGSIESRHGEGRVDPSTGDVLPPILGPALDGRSGFARIPDPQSGDGWAHAEGPMQFLPDTWRRWGRLAPGRPTGIVSSPNNAWDAIWTAAAYLCGSVGRVSDVRAAIRSFNHSDAYVNKVLAKAAEYEVAVHARPAGASGMVCPVTVPLRHSKDFHACLVRADVCTRATTSSLRTGRSWWRSRTASSTSPATWRSVSAESLCGSEGRRGRTGITRTIRGTS